MEDSAVKTLADGLKFGIILQLAVGPVCLFVFKSAIEKGLLSSMLVVLAAALVDAFYIFWAIFGITSFLNSGKAKKILKYAGFVILLVFGLNIIVFEIIKFNFIPPINVIDKFKFDSPFLSGLILTLSSPLTIIFWLGVFSGRIRENGDNRGRIILFGSGCVAATLFFLSAVSLTGSLFKIFLPIPVIRLMNITVGLVIIYFAFRFLFAKKESGA